MNTHFFDVELAERYGINAAIIIQHIAFWIKKNRANRTHFYDGRYWTYMSLSAFAEMFPYLGMKQIRGAIDKLKAEGLILTGNYSTKGKINTTWYSLTDKGERLVFQGSTENFPCQNDTQLCQNDTEPCQNGTMLCQNGTTKTDINTDNRQRYNHISAQEDDDSAHDSACAGVRTYAEDMPQESITDYLEYSETAEAYADEISPEEMRQYIRTSWKYHIGKTPNKTNVDDVQATAENHQMQVSTINFAISAAARNANGSITGYVCMCLRSWAALGYHSLGEVIRADIEFNGI